MTKIAHPLTGETKDVADETVQLWLAAGWHIADK